VPARRAKTTGRSRIGPGRHHLTLLLSKAEIRQLRTAADVRSVGSLVSKLLADDLKRRRPAKGSHPALGRITDRRQLRDAQVGPDRSMPLDVTGPEGWRRAPPGMQGATPLS
jgi:hypothetical protein